ncbi:MAG: hypothetical protein FIA94_02455 [Nitrospirae bacterium]|nr:hypothetical protein [Nitrospirota bacterium]
MASKKASQKFPCPASLLAALASVNAGTAPVPDVAASMSAVRDDPQAASDVHFPSSGLSPPAV